MIDLACGALLAIVAIAVAAGIGIVAVGALLALLAVIAWAGLESVLARAHRHSAIRR